MSQEEMKAIYDSLIESGDFKILFPTLLGDWDKDKKSFKKLYSDSQSILEDTNLDFDTEDELY
jgi:hypothetical protein